MRASSCNCYACVDAADPADRWLNSCCPPPLRSTAHLGRATASAQPTSTSAPRAIHAHTHNRLRSAPQATFAPRGRTMAVSRAPINLRGSPASTIGASRSTAPTGVRRRSLALPGILARAHRRHPCARQASFASREPTRAWRVCQTGLVRSPPSRAALRDRLANLIGSSLS